MVRIPFLLAHLAASVCAALAQEPPIRPCNARSTNCGTRSAKCEVVMQFLNEDGTVQTSAKGTYTFDWVVQDRVVSGRSDMLSMKRSVGILFYSNERRKVIEMVSVGEDVHLWIMTGPLGGDARQSAELGAGQEERGSCGSRART